MLLSLAGKPLVLHAVERARSAANVARVIVATDDERIFTVVADAGCEAVMTRLDHSSGSDRVAEVAETLPAGSVLVNLQGDEPLIAPETIDRAIEPFLAGGAEPDIVTVSEPITDKYGELLNPNVVKVVTRADGTAVYFSRSPIPFPRAAAGPYGGSPDKLIEEDPAALQIFRRHVGLYVYRREYLLRFTRMEPTVLERIELLEQLRALENGARILVVEAAGRSIGIDTEEDFEKVREMLDGEVAVV